MNCIALSEVVVAIDLYGAIVSKYLELMFPRSIAVPLDPECMYKYQGEKRVYGEVVEACL